MKTNAYEITSLDPKGILAEMGVEIGDRLLDINDIPVQDGLDIFYAEQNEDLFVRVEKPDGEIWEIDIEKDEDESLGLDPFGDSLGIRRCHNQCVFCFIDQMPPGMRETLYVKDDDERLSFLQGNYVTLTNLSEDFLHRIVRYRMMPMNISVHTTDPDLRCQMLRNRFAGKIKEQLAYLAENDIAMNGQIVLCPGLNDGEALKQTLSDLTDYYPQMGSVSVVPVGLSKYRAGLAVLTPVDRAVARQTLESIGEIQNEMLEQHGTRFVFPSDELFLLAEIPLPDAAYYEDFAQLENGVGMLADFENALDAALAQHRGMPLPSNPGKIGIITGMLAADFMRDCCRRITSVFPELAFEVIPVENTHFGSSITVSGLVTGGDIIREMQKNFGCDLAFIPENMVRYQTEIFLDDLTVTDVSEAIGMPLVVVPVDGRELIQLMIG